MAGELDYPSLWHLAAGENCLETHLRVGIVCGQLEQLVRVRQPIMPATGKSCREGAEAMIVGGQCTLEQLWAGRLGGCAQRESLKQVAAVIRLVGIHPANPSIGHVAHE